MLDHKIWCASQKEGLFLGQKLVKHFCKFYIPVLGKYRCMNLYQLKAMTVQTEINANTLLWHRVNASFWKFT